MEDVGTGCRKMVMPRKERTKKNMCKIDLQSNV